MEALLGYSVRGRQSNGELMAEQDAGQGEGKGPAADTQIGMICEPSPGPEVGVADHRGHPFKEVLHEARAVDGGGDDAGEQKQQGQGVIAKKRTQPGPFRKVAPWGWSTREWVVQKNEQA